MRIVVINQGKTGVGGGKDFVLILLSLVAWWAFVKRLGLMMLPSCMHNYKDNWVRTRLDWISFFVGWLFSSLDEGWDADGML